MLYNPTNWIQQVFLQIFILFVLGKMKKKKNKKKLNHGWFVLGLARIFITFLELFAKVFGLGCLLYRKFKE